MSRNGQVLDGREVRITTEQEGEYVSVTITHVGSGLWGRASGRDTAYPTLLAAAERALRRKLVREA